MKTSTKTRAGEIIETWINASDFHKVKEFINVTNRRELFVSGTITEEEIQNSIATAVTAYNEGEFVQAQRYLDDLESKLLIKFPTHKDLDLCGHILMAIAEIDEKFLETISNHHRYQGYRRNFYSSIDAQWILARNGNYRCFVAINLENEIGDPTFDAFVNTYSYPQILIGTVNELHELDDLVTAKTQS